MAHELPTTWKCLATPNATAWSPTMGPRHCWAMIHSELSITYDFVVNLKPAAAVGTAIPPQVMAQATEITSEPQTMLCGNERF